MTVAPSGDQLGIAAGGYEAVVTQCGATLRTMTYAGRAIVAGFPEDRHADSGRGQLLMPWPNRIAGGRYEFGGREHQLPLSEVARGNASHGLVRWAAWTVVEHTDTAVDLTYRLMAQPGYPWTLDLSARYSLSPAGLRVEVNAANLSAEPAPFAAGAHPYVALDGCLDDWHLHLPSGTVLEVDDRMIPTGRRDVTGTDLDFRAGRRIGHTVLDTAFTDLDRAVSGDAEVTVSDGDLGVTVWMDDAHPWVQIYAGVEHAPRTVLAVEPMTAPPDAFNSGEDLVTLSPAGRPGDRYTCTWGLRAQSVGL